MLPSQRTECVIEVGWLNLSTLIAQLATGVQPHQTPDSSQTRPGEAA